MGALLDDSRDVPPPACDLLFVLVPRLHAGKLVVVDVDRKRQRLRRVADHVDGPFGEVLPWDDSMGVDERALALHRDPKTDVVGVIAVSAAIPVQQALDSHHIVVRLPCRSFGAVVVMLSGISRKAAGRKMPWMAFIRGTR